MGIRRLIVITNDALFRMCFELCIKKVSSRKELNECIRECIESRIAS